MNTFAAALSDAALLTETSRVAEAERRSTSQLIALLAEMDSRRLYLGQGYPSLFAWCTQVLHLSESSAYSRITAARTARRFPVVLQHLADGSVTLTAVSLLASHLTDEHHEALLGAAQHKSKRDVERLVACLDPQPDVAASVRRLPAASLEAPSAPSVSEVAPSDETVAARELLVSKPAVRRAVVAPLSPDRYLLKVTLSQETRAKLTRIQDLLRHSVPNGDAAAIVDRALTVLLDQLEKTKHAATDRPRPRPSARSSPATSSRHVPAAVKRAVWTRDEGRCAFVGQDGRCRATGFLEFHHVVPFARGGPTSVGNLQLRCRAHNAYEAEQELGEAARVWRAGRRRTLSGQSSENSRDSHSHVPLDSAHDFS